MIPRTPIAGGGLISNMGPIRTRVPIATPARPIQGHPVSNPLPVGPARPINFFPPATGTSQLGTAIVSPGQAGSVALAPQGGSGILSMQPSGPPPSGAPPSMSMVTSVPSSGAPPGAIAAAAQVSLPASLNGIPSGWILLAGVLVLIFVLARE